MRDNPDAPRAAEAVAMELSAWLLEAAPLRVDGVVVEASLGTSGSSVATLGALAGIAIPAFTRYVNRAKTSEATRNVMFIATALADSTNRLPAARRRPSAIAAVPAAAPSSAPYSADPTRWNTPGWQRIGFHIDQPHRDQYRVDVDGRCFVVRASGDLDGDGTRSSFSRRVSAS